MTQACRLQTMNIFSYSRFYFSRNVTSTRGRKKFKGPYGSSVFSCHYCLQLRLGLPVVRRLPVVRHLPVVGHPVVDLPVVGPPVVGLLPLLRILNQANQ